MTGTEQEHGPWVVLSAGKSHYGHCANAFCNKEAGMHSDTKYWWRGIVMFIHLYVKFLRVTFLIFLLCQRNSTWTLKPEIPFSRVLSIHYIYIGSTYSMSNFHATQEAARGGGIFYLEIETVDLVTKQVPPAYKQIETKLWIYNIYIPIFITHIHTLLCCNVIFNIL